MKLSLYHVANNYVESLNKLISMKEVDEQCVKDTIEALSGDFESKALNVAAYIKNIEYDIQTMKDYEADIKQKRQSLEKKSERLREYLKINMQKVGFEKVKGQELTIHVKPCQASLVIENEELIPTTFKKIQISVDKFAVKDYISKGGIIAGAHLENNTALIIK